MGAFGAAIIPTASHRVGRSGFQTSLVHGLRRVWMMFNSKLSFRMARISVDDVEFHLHDRG